MADKVEKCPKCESENLGDRWTEGRKLTRYCHECRWTDKPRTPEKQPVSTTKWVSVDQFHGVVFYIFDKYGHTAEISRTYRTEAEAMKDLKFTLACGRKPRNSAGPYTAILWPAKVKVKGKKFV